MSHIERRQKEKEEVKQKILEAAQKIASKDGWNAVTIRKIADEIEYTPPIVYEYFESKEDLIREIVFSGFTKLSKEFIAARESETDPKKILEILSMVHWDFAFANKELYQLMFHLEKPMANEEMHESRKFIEETFLKLLNEREALFEVMFSWMCIVNGAISVVMKFPNMHHLKGRDPKELYKSMIRRFVNSLK